jgi:hypothetical protein
VQLPLNLIKSIVVLVPENAELEMGFQRWIATIMNFTKQTRAALKVHGSQKTVAAFQEVMGNSDLNRQVFTDRTETQKLLRELRTNELLVIVSARKGSVSFNSNFDNTPTNILRVYPKSSFIIIYPEQNPVNTENVYTTQEPHFMI